MKSLRYLVFFVPLVGGITYAQEDDIGNAFGLTVGMPLPVEIVDEAHNPYPTKRLDLPVPDNDELGIFDSLVIQYIEETKEIYSLVAEVELESGLACIEEEKKLILLLDNTYESLKVTRELEHNGQTVSSFDGYLSRDGKRKLSILCGTSQRDSVYRLSISIWDQDLGNYADALWDQFIR